MSSRVAASAVLLLFVLPWTAITMGFNFLMVSGIVRQAQSASWPSVPGTILTSEVESVRGGKSTTHGLKVLYTWTVEGQRYEGTRYRLNAWRSSDRGYAEGLVERFPAGVTVPVYYRPGQPSEAVLVAGMQGAELFLLMFLLPFNLVTLWLGTVLVRVWRRDERLPRTFFREDGSECVTLGNASPIDSACLTLGISALVCVVLCGLTVGFNPPLPVAAVAWVAVIACGLAAGLRTRTRLKTGYYDLRIHAQARSLSLPPVSGRKAPLELRWSDVQSLRVEPHLTTSRGRTHTHYRPTLELTTGSREVITSFGSQEEAEALARWLQSYLKCDELTPGEQRSA